MYFTSLQTRTYEIYQNVWELELLNLVLLLIKDKIFVAGMDSETHACSYKLVQTDFYKYVLCFIINAAEEDGII